MPTPLGAELFNGELMFSTILSLREQATQPSQMLDMSHLLIRGPRNVRQLATVELSGQKSRLSILRFST
jgi:hypothetical protein